LKGAICLLKADKILRGDEGYLRISRGQVGATVVINLSKVILTLGLNMIGDAGSKIILTLGLNMIGDAGSKALMRANLASQKKKKKNLPL